MESIIKALFNWALVVQPDGSIRILADVFLMAALIIGLFMVYRYKLAPLLSTLEQMLPRWQAQSLQFDALVQEHSAVAARLVQTADQLKLLEAQQAAFQEQVRGFIRSHPDALEQLAAATVNQHSETQHEIRDWLDNLVAKNQDSDRQLATIQAELRNISALLVATSAARYSKPLN